MTRCNECGAPMPDHYSGCSQVPKAISKTELTPEQQFIRGLCNEPESGGFCQYPRCGCNDIIELKAAYADAQAAMKDKHNDR